MTISDFFKGKKEYLVSDFLLNHPLKDKYFYRLLQFRTTSMNDITVVAIDSKSPRVITFGPWPQLIFLNATGLKTIFQFTMEMAHIYKGKVPLGLENTIIDQIEILIQEGVIATSRETVILPADLLYAIDNK